MKQYDTVVIGGGIAGITAAALLATNRQRVLLVDQSNHLGGLIHTVQYRGIAFPVGAHHLSGSAINGLSRRILSQLGIPTEKVLHPVEAMGVTLDGVQYTIEMSLDGLEHFLLREFPEESKSREFLAELRRYCDYYISNCAENLLQFFKETCNLSFDCFLDRFFTQRRLKRLLCYLGEIYGGLDHTESAFSNLSLLVSYYCGTSYIDWGEGGLLERLTTRLQALQVDILTETQFSAVCKEDERVVGAQLLDRKSQICYNVLSKQVVLAINPRQTLTEQFPTLRASKKILRLSNGPSAVRVIGVAGKVIDGIHNCNVVRMTSNSKVFLEPDFAQLPTYVLCYPEMFHDQLPGQVAFMLTFLTEQPSTLDAEELKTKLLCLLARDDPDVYHTIEHCQVIPSTVYRSLSGGTSASIFGWKRDAMTTIYTNSFCPSVPGAENLYICGNWSTDFGLYGALRSSELVCKQILNRSETEPESSQR